MESLFACLTVGIIDYLSLTSLALFRWEGLDNRHVACRSIVVTNLIALFEQHTIGGPDRGYVDGPFKTARFCNPQGTAFLNDDVFFVADTGNHCVRMVSAAESNLCSCNDISFTGSHQYSWVQFKACTLLVHRLTYELKEYLHLCLRSNHLRDQHLNHPGIFASTALKYY